MKALILLVCLFVFRLPSMYADGPATTYAVTGIANDDTLNVRSGPGMKYPLVARLRVGDTGIRVRGGIVMNGNDDWVPIIFANTVGWTRPKFLAVADSLTIEDRYTSTTPHSDTGTPRTVGLTTKVVSYDPRSSDEVNFHRAVLANDVSAAARYVSPAYVDEPFKEFPNDTDAWPPVVHAVTHGYNEMLAFLARNGAVLDRHYKGMSLVCIAALAGFDGTAQTAVELGAGTQADIADGKARRAGGQNRHAMSAAIGLILGGAILKAVDNEDKRAAEAPHLSIFGD